MLKWAFYIKYIILYEKTLTRQSWQWYFQYFIRLFLKKFICDCRNREKWLAPTGSLPNKCQFKMQSQVLVSRVQVNYLNASCNNILDTILWNFSPKDEASAFFFSKLLNEEKGISHNSVGFLHLLSNSMTHCPLLIENTENNSWDLSQEWNGDSAFTN